MPEMLLAGLSGALLVAGLVMVAAGFLIPPRPQGLSTNLWTTLVDGRVGRFLRSQGWRLALAVAVGVLGATVTGWPVLLVLVPLVGYGVPTLLSQPPQREAELLQALDRWVRSIAALLPTGRSITDAIRASQRQAPPQLVESLGVLIARLDDRWTPHQALLAMADDLDSADADAVLAALALATQRGGTGAAATLASLADTVQDRLGALREIEAERAKPRIVVRQVTIITVTVLALALVFGGSFFEPYGTPVGQVILSMLIGAYLGSLAFLRRMTLPRVRERILRRTP